MTDITPLVHKFIEKLIEQGIPVTQAFLFGSYARGTANEYSDIDVCVVSPVLGNDHVEEMVKLRRIAYPIDSRIEPIPLHTSDLEDRYSTLVSEIKLHGKLISSTKT